MPRRKSKTLVKRKKSPKNKRKNKTMKLRRKRSRKYRRRKQKGGEEKGMVREFIEGSGNSSNAPSPERQAQIARDRKAHQAIHGKPPQEGFTASDAAHESTECSIM